MVNLVNKESLANLDDPNLYCKLLVFSLGTVLLKNLRKM